MAQPVKKKAPKKQPPTQQLDDLINKWGWVLLIALPLLMYFRTIGYNITQLDDYIFIIDKAEFNKHIGNIFKAFTTGVFNEKDVYYRPLFLVLFVLEHPWGIELNNPDTALRVYHITNLVLHLANVLVLFFFLKQLNIKPLTAFLLTLLFALHPVLTMAVAWIPGVNDMLLTLFSLLFLKSFLKYIRNPQRQSFIGQLVWLLLAFFTKETAVLLPLAAMGLYFVYLPSPMVRQAHHDKPAGVTPNLSNHVRGLLWVFVSWVGIFILWYLLRLTALDSKYFSRTISQTLVDGFSRLPAYLVYLGKIFIPVNLSVFPSLSNMPLLYGYISIAILAALVLLTRKKNYKIMLLGMVWFVLFILPFFFVPKEINDQVFEHRLYLPLIGILIFLSQTALFNGEIKKEYTLAGTGVILIVSFFVSNSYIKTFNAPLVFWQNAVKASPESSYAQKLVGVRLMEAGQKTEALVHFQEAYRLNKEEKHVRFFIARDVLEPKDSLDKAMKLLREELAINSNYTEAYFELSHLFFMKNKTDSSVKYLLKARELQPADKTINNNLLLTLIKLNDYNGVMKQINYMVSNGLPVDENARNQAEAIPH